MLSRLTLTQKVDSRKEKVKGKERFYPLYYALTGFLFGGILVLSALNDFLFFGWLSISMSIIFGLLTIHLLGKEQIKRS